MTDAAFFKLSSYHFIQKSSQALLLIFFGIHTSNTVYSKTFSCLKGRTDGILKIVDDGLI